MCRGLFVIVVGVFLIFLFLEVAFCLLFWGGVFGVFLFGGGGLVCFVVGVVFFFGGGEVVLFAQVGRWLCFGFVLFLLPAFFSLETERDENSWPERGKRR